MKKIILLILVVAMYSCSETKPSEKHEALEKAEKKLVENLNLYSSVWDKIINERQIDQINEINFDNEVTLVLKPENIVGVEGVKAFYNNYLNGFSNAEFKIVDVFGQGDNIVKHWNFKGTHDGEFFGILASGRRVDISGTTLVKMKEGKILQEQDFFDNLDFYQQLGLMPTE